MKLDRHPRPFPVLGPVKPATRRRRDSSTASRSTSPSILRSPSPSEARSFWPPRLAVRRRRADSVRTRSLVFAGMRRCQARCEKRLGRPTVIRRRPSCTSQVAWRGWHRRLVRRKSLGEPSEHPEDGREEPARKHPPNPMPSLIARGSSPGSYVKRFVIERVLDDSAWRAGGQNERSRTTRRRLREKPPLPGPFHACTYESTHRAGESAGSGACRPAPRSRSRPRAVFPYRLTPLSIIWRKRHRSPATTSRPRSAARLRDVVLVSTSYCPDLNQLGPGLPRDVQAETFHTNRL